MQEVNTNTNLAGLFVLVSDSGSAEDFDLERL